jgi:RecJ-like exonuclease
MLSGAGICYLFAKTISANNKDLAHLAVIGMVGDLLEKNIHQTYQEILDDSGAVIKKGLLLYPSTRPLDRTLQYCSNPYIPGVTGDYKGTLDLLREANLQRENGKFQSLQDLSEGEMKQLITAIALKCAGKSDLSEYIGNLYLINLFNQLEDAREVSALINACSRMGHPEVALGFCLGNPQSKQQAEKVYIGYKQKLVEALKHVENEENIKGKTYTIIHGKDHIKDTIIGTVASILSHSPAYEEGTIIIGMAYNEDKIKVSARLAGKKGRNVREVLHNIVVPLGGEVGGHPNAAGCMIDKNHEDVFIEQLQRQLDIEVVKA